MFFQNKSIDPRFFAFFKFFGGKEFYLTDL